MRKWLWGPIYFIPLAGLVGAQNLQFQNVIIDDPGAILHPHVKTLGDIDLDGFIDVVAASSSDGNDGLVWYAYPDWTKHQIAAGSTYTTDMQVGDVDHDGDLDAIIPKGTHKGISVWWYENPVLPAGDPTTPWAEHYIGDAGAHDVEVGDVDNNGLLDVVVRIGTTTLFLQTSPNVWSKIEISTRSEEGTALGDIDGDGDLDVAINGYWLENPLPSPGNMPGGQWTEHQVTSSQPSRVGAHIADINADGFLDILYAASESADGKLAWYEAPNPSDPTVGPWIEHVIDGAVSYVHTFKTADMDLDGRLDVVTAEMHQSSDPDEVSVYLKKDIDGASWEQVIIADTGSHNIRVGDIGNDGDIDIMGANWNSSAPNGAPIEIWENQTAFTLSLDNWTRHQIDGALPWRAVFIDSADADGDGLKDIIAGGWWFKNPGSPAGNWARNAFGGSLDNMAAVHDFDGDGDKDVLGTTGQPSSQTFVWARNDGSGTFTILNNLETADGDFLQGVAPARFAPGGPLQVALSWHAGNKGVQTFTVPSDPSVDTWTWNLIHDESQDEALSEGDIDDDGDADLFQGTKWLRNDAGSWTQFTATGNGGIPDRNRLADIDGDGDLDAVVAFEGDVTDLIWLQAPEDPTQAWTEHTIASAVGGGFSLDVADMDNDGDIDAILGEHKGDTRVLIYENDGAGGTWTPHLVDAGGSGIDHHDGTQTVDIDGDGDLDIISIGWFNQKVWLFENGASASGATPPSVPTDLTATAISPSRIDLSWNASTDNTGVSHYRILRDGAEVGAPSVTTYSDTGLAASTEYTYAIIAVDTGGSESAASAPASATTFPPDTTPPSAPAGLSATAVSSSRIDLNWTPSTDNVGVSHYRVLRDGLEVGTPNGASFSDRGLARETSYTYTVIAVDTSGNASAASSPASAETLATDPTLKLAYGFEEASGAAVVDATGNGNDAVLENGGQRNTDGYSGAAVEFDGSSGRVNLGGFDVSGDALTLTLWFRADDFGTFDARLISKATGVQEQDHYWMLSTIDGPRLRFRLKTANGGTQTLIADGATLTQGEWTHAAVTYDGAHMVIYQNGAEVGRAAKTGALATNPAVEAWIGDNPGGTKAFDGRIDETRIYCRALSAAEIQLEMGNQIDSEPPTVPAGLTATPLSSSRIDLSWTASTDNVGVSRYRVLRDGTEVGLPAGNAYSDTGLAADTEYTYTVIAVDAAGNQSAASAPAAATTLPPGATAPPAPTGLTATAISTSQIDLSWTAGTHQHDPSGWWDASWNYRIPLDVNVGGHQRMDKPVTVDIDFTPILNGLGQFGALDVNSIRLIEVDGTGQISDTQVAFQFDPDPDFDALTKASGSLTLMMKGSTAAGAVRTVHVYFDVVAAGPFAPPVVVPQVTLTDGVIDEGQESFQIATNNATYFHQKQGAGFSSLVDADGNDWIDHHAVGGSAGDFRGIPNLIHPEGEFHPGAAGSTSTIINQGPVKVTVHSETNDGLWECVWDIYPGYATMTLLKSDHGYWFLYEGTPGGVLEPASDFIVRSDGAQTLASESWEGDLANDEWLYFSDPNVGRSLFLAHHQDDSAVDSYRPMNGEMTVFGFGRQDLNATMDQVPAQFTIGLMDETNFIPAALLVRSAFEDLASVTLGTAEQNPGDAGLQQLSEVDGEGRSAPAHEAKAVLYRVLRDGFEVGISATTTYSDTDLTPGTEYTYTVIAVDESGNESAPSAPAAAATFDEPLTAPTGLTAAAISSTQIDLSWVEPKDNLGVSQYRIYRNGARTGVSPMTSFSDTGLTPATAYTYTVTAVDTSENETARSAPATATTLDGPPPSPVPTEALELWLRADQGVTLNGDTVSRWIDQSGNGRDAAQATAAHQPTLEQNMVAGQPALRFDGVDDYLTFNLPLNGLTEMSLVVVSASMVDHDPGFFGAVSAPLFWNQSASWGTVHLSPFQSRVRFRFGTEQSDNLPEYVRLESIDDQFSLTIAVKAGSDERLYLNGNLVMSAQGKLMSISGVLDTGNLGRGFNDATFFDGRIAEALVYHKALNGGELDQIEEYLLDKYLPANAVDAAIWMNY